MKKYVKPVLEIIQTDSLCVVDQSVSPWGEAKENNLFLFDDEEFDDENDLWNNNSHKDDYNLWED